MKRITLQIKINKDYQQGYRDGISELIELINNEISKLNKKLEKMETKEDSDGDSD